MKPSVVVIFMFFSQLSLAKIANFDSLIKEHTELQKEIHNSIQAETRDNVEVTGVELNKQPEIIVLDTNHQVYSQIKKPKKNEKKANLKKKKSASDDIESKHFQRLGEELNNAQ